MLGVAFVLAFSLMLSIYASVGGVGGWQCRSFQTEDSKFIIVYASFRNSPVSHVVPARAGVFDCAGIFGCAGARWNA